MTGISYIVTFYNKHPYLERVADSITRQDVSVPQEVIFVDDGSTDGSSALARKLVARWGENGSVIQQRNLGASAATNVGAAKARFPWLKLLDGDDILVPQSSRVLLGAAQQHGVDFSWGELGEYSHDDPDPLAGYKMPAEDSELEVDGLARFIRINIGNSSSMLVSRERFLKVGGCDERLISPDSMLFLRLFADGPGARIKAPVALIPSQAADRLSGQQRRSRYESVLALYFLVREFPGLSRKHAKLAYRRAMSRAYRYHRRFGGWPIVTAHYLRYLLSKVHVPNDPAPGIWKSLSAFTEDGRSERPPSWLPGALRTPEGQAR